MATNGTYKVKQDYSSGLGSFEKGQTVELDDDLAEHIERDAPGTLDMESRRAQRALESPAQDRMVRAAPNRAFPDGPPLSRIAPPQYPLVPTEEDAELVQEVSAVGAAEADVDLPPGGSPAVASDVLASSEAEDPDVPSEPYAGKTVAELRDLAAERNIEGRSAMNRAELIAALGEPEE